MFKKKIHRLYTWFNVSFSRKIMIALLICMSFIIIFSSIVYYYSTIELLQNEYIDSNEQLLKEVNQNIIRYYEQLDETSRSLYSNNTFINNLYTHQNDYVSVAYNEQVISDILRSDDAIRYIYFYEPYTQTLYSFSRENTSHAFYPDLEKEEWYQKTLCNKHYFYITPIHIFKNYTNFGTFKDETVFSVNRAVRYYVTGDIIGMLSISYDTSYLEKLCQNLNTTDSFVSILNEDLQIRLTDYPELQIPELITEYIRQADSIQGYYKYNTDNGRRILLWNKSEDNYLLKDIPLNELTGKALIVLQITLLFSAIIFIISIALALYFSRSATRRLKKLADNIIEFGEGNLSINAVDYGNDEIGQLASSFYDMTEKINELINLEYKAKMLRKTAELQALQARIKPHFINNALQALGTLGLKKGANDVYFMANALAKMFRYTLKSASELVPLSKEIDNMNDYLYIQKILWNDKLKVELQIDEGIEDHLVPVLILQPLVENSIKHGLDDCMEGWIQVEVHAEDSILSIKVTDNGRGIPDASLTMLHKWLEDETIAATDEHVGIRNIASRLKLIYGSNAAFNIYSPPEGGTSIHIILPDKEV